MNIEIQHNTKAQRFEAHVEGHLCRTDYRLDDGVMVMPHTEVPPPVGGRGIAARLVAAALAWAREQGLRVDARCSYVRSYMQRHPETRSLLA
jgi:predicted GNAT family acetyltransferase